MFEDEFLCSVIDERLHKEITLVFVIHKDSKMIDWPYIMNSWYFDNQFLFIFCSNKNLQHDLCFDIR